MTALDALGLAAPAAVLAFTGLARRANRAGARPLPRGWAAFALGASALWLGASRLAAGGAVPGLDTALAGGFTVLLLAHAGVQLLALRPLLGLRLPRRPPLVFLALPLIVYAALLPWTASVRPPDGDEPYYLLLTHSLLEDGDADLADDYAAGEGRRFLNRPLEPQPGDPTGPRGEIYSRHNLLLPLLLVLPYALAGKAGALATMALLAALLAWRTLALAARIHPHRPGGALLAFGTVVLASPLVVYSGQVWVEVPAALALVVALERLFDWVKAPPRAPAGTSPAASLGRTGSSWAAAAPVAAGVGGGAPPAPPLPGGEGAFLFALAVAALPLLKLRFALVAIPLVALALWRLRRTLDRRLIHVFLGVAFAAGAGVLVYNQVAYGNPLKIHSWQELDLARFGPGRYLQGLLGLFFDAGFGLFGAAPLWLLTLPALLLALARRDRWLGIVLVLAAPYLLFAAPRDEWYGGWSPPFRYGMVFLPLLAILLVPLFAERRRSGLARGLTVALAAASLALGTLYVAVPGFAYNLAHGRTHWTDRLALATGLDVARFVPSYVRPRTASWVWPPLALALTAVAFRSTRRGRGSSAMGAAVVLGAVGALPLLAARCPTRTVELEDPWVEHRGGHLYPEMWTMSRVGYRGGWVLRPAESLAVPVIAGGPRLTLEVELRFVRNNPDPLTLEVLAGDQVVHHWRAEGAGEWRQLALPPIDWRPGLALGLRTMGPSRGGPQNGILIDRLEISWS